MWVFLRIGQGPHVDFLSVAVSRGFQHLGLEQGQFSHDTVREMKDVFADGRRGCFVLRGGDRSTAVVLGGRAQPGNRTPRLGAVAVRVHLFVFVLSL